MIEKGLELVKSFVTPCEKLIESVEGAIGKLYEPKYIRKMTDAKAYEIEKIGQAIRENCDVPIIYKNGEIVMNNENVDAFIQRTQNRFAYQQLVKQKNIEAVLDRAYNELENEENVTDEPIDKDWMLRFVNNIEDISNEEMQLLWAKIIAGEVKRPKTFSLRTLEVLHNISIDEAKLFQKVAPYIIKKGKHSFFPNYDSLFQLTKIKYDDILKLNEIGLINSSGMLVLNIPIKKEKMVFAENENYIITTSLNKEESTVVSIEQYPLTKVGMEIIDLFEKVENNEFFIQFGREVKKLLKNGEVNVYKIIKKHDGYVEHEGNDLIAEIESN